MPLSTDRQPLVPPALKRIKNELRCHGTGPDLHSQTHKQCQAQSPARYVQPPHPPDSSLVNEAEMDNTAHRQGVREGREIRGESQEGWDDCSATDGGRDGAAGDDWSTILPDVDASRRSENIKAQSAPGRPVRSSLQGLVNQFSQLHIRRPTFNRLTFTLGSLFGRMCSRRRGVSKGDDDDDDDNDNDYSDDSDDEEENSNVSSGDEGVAVRDREAARRGAGGYESVLSDAATVGDSDEDLLGEFGFSLPVASSSVLDPGDVSDADSQAENKEMDVDLGDGEAVRDKGGREDDRCILYTDQERVRSASPPSQQRRARWTLLSPLSLLKAVKSRKDPRPLSQQLRTPNSPSQGGWGRLQFLDITNSSTDRSVVHACDQEGTFKQTSPSMSANASMISSESLSMPLRQDKPRRRLDMSDPIASTCAGDSSAPRAVQSAENVSSSSAPHDVFGCELVSQPLVKWRGDQSGSCMNPGFCDDGPCDNEVSQRLLLESMAASDDRGTDYAANVSCDVGGTD